MLNFDRSLVYQFAFFLGEIDENQKNLPQLLPAIIQDEVSGIQIPIRFGEPRIGTTFELTPSGPQERSVLVWRGGVESGDSISQILELTYSLMPGGRPI